MLVIRLARTGRAKYPTYRIVAAESSRPATGRFVEVLGNYNPHTKDLTVNHDATLARLSQGAQPSNTVIKLLRREQLELPAWVKLKTKTAPVVASTEVTPAEAEADATSPEPEAEPAVTPEVSIDAPALHDETRVGGAVEDVVVDVADDNAVNVNETETEVSEDRIQERAEAAQDAAADAAASTDATA